MMNIHIAICDDEPMFVRETESGIYSAAQRKGLSVDCFSFLSGQELLDECRKTRIDAVFLDILMPNVDGFRIAETLKKEFPEILLIFVSVKESMVFSSYEYQPFWFVPKGKPALLTMVIEKVLAKIREKEFSPQSVTVLLDRRMVSIDFGDATHFVSRDHYVKEMAENGKVLDTFRETLDHVEELLSPHGFIRAHNRYLVNLRRISAIKSDSCILQNGEIIPVSRRYSKELRDAFQRYLRDGIPSDIRTPPWFKKENF